MNSGEDRDSLCVGLVSNEGRKSSDSEVEIVQSLIGVCHSLGDDGSVDS